jgi:nucleoside-diphosphate-sugar epimerase
VKVLITGATGFVGECYVQHLVTTRPDVKVHFCGRQLDAGNALAAATGAHFFRGDLLDKPFVQHICKDIDGVVHCAGRAGAWGDYELYYRDNVIATENLLQACLGAGVRRFVNISSPSIYFDFRDRVNVVESFLPDRFADNYARTKYQAETRVANAHSDQLRTLSLRPRMVLGLGERNFFPRIIDMQRTGQLRRIGDGSNVVSATHIDNLLQAMDCALFGPDSVTGDVYNIADAQPYAVWGMVDQLLQAVALPPVTRQVAYPAALLVAGVVETCSRLLRREQEPGPMRLKVALLARSFTLNTDKARRKLGYRPTATLDDAIAEFAQDWLRQHPSGTQISV